MNLLWHLIKYNFIFNKIRLIFMAILALTMFVVANYFHDKPEDLGDFLVQYSLYIFFVVFTGKMNAKNNLMFDIKQMISFPMNSFEMVVTKSIADVIHFVPVCTTLFYGAILKYPNIHPVFLITGGTGFLVVANIISLNKRVDFSRMQHSKASFINSILFFHKYLEMMFQVTLALLVVVVLFFFVKNPIIQMYFTFVMVIFAIGLSSIQTLKMLTDETRSYFIWKRDVWRIGWKVAVISVPLMFFKFFYKDASLNQSNLKIEGVKQSLSLASAISNQDLYLTIIEGGKFVPSQLKRINLETLQTRVQNMSLIELSILSHNEKTLEQIASIKRKDFLELKHMYRGFLFTAAKACNLHALNILGRFIRENNFYNIQTKKDGDTPLILSAKKKCHGTSIRLVELGANPYQSNKEGKTALSFVRNKSLVQLIKMKSDFKEPKKRAISSVAPKESLSSPSKQKH